MYFLCLSFFALVVATSEEKYSAASSVRISIAGFYYQECCKNLKEINFLEKNFKFFLIF